MLRIEKYLKYFIILVIISCLALGVYLIVRDKKYLNEISFTLIGEEKVKLFSNEKYKDLGYNIFNNNGGSLPKVITDSDLNINKNGIYKITYTIKKGFFKKTITRTLIVREEDYYDLELTLNGDNRVYILNGHKYNEQGAKAIDKKLGDLSSNIEITGEVNNMVNGDYEITYKITTSYGLTKELKRIVTVYTLAYSLELETNEIVKDGTNFIFNTNDDTYSHVLLPDGKILVDKSFSYKVTNNNIYVFKIYDRNNSEIIREFEVKNIDLSPPTGKCTGIMYDSYTILNVIGYDDLGIDGYVYYYGNNSSEKKSENTFTYKELINNAKVDIYDKVGNKTSSECVMTDNSTVIMPGYTTSSYLIPELNKTIRYWIYVPKNNHVRSKIPLMVYLHGDGSKGNNLNLVNNYAFPSFIKNEGYEYPFIMIAPQCSSDTNWTGIYDRVKYLIDFITKNYNIDTEKIILSGGSSGGKGAYMMASVYQNFFSCLVVGAGRIEVRYASQLTNLPIWAFHGTNDKAVPYSDAKALIDAINKFGGNAKLTTINGGGHNITETALKDPKLVEWMIKETRKKN